MRTGATVVTIKIGGMPSSDAVKNALISAGKIPETGRSRTSQMGRDRKYHGHRHLLIMIVLQAHQLGQGIVAASNAVGGELSMNPRRPVCITAGTVIALI
jgi:hypothetical protein